MTANFPTNHSRARLVATGAIAAAVAVVATLAAPAASAAPVGTDLVLGPSQFPAGSTDYRVSPNARLGKISVTPDAPAPCRGAADRLNASLSSAKAAEAFARNGYSAMLSTVISPPVTNQWRAVASSCASEGERVAPAPDLARYAPVVLATRENGRTTSIEGFADVNGYTVDVYVEGASETPVNAERFWQVFRSQIRKVQTGN
ncbi:hypothetical protein [Tsukamurella sp. 1534]|uniref:hypothetical protein n=1 Tax=Tsukamurella sp. 1534 TaxID=1151061 RepID=UPI0003126865|nr:hypothetical protein [Tsukamurella sp. 1534]